MMSASHARLGFRCAAGIGFPDFGRDLAEVASYGLLHACYGGFQQGTIPNDPETGEPRPDEFNLIALRANAVVANEDWIADYTNLFTTLREDMEADNTAYLISSFTPHSNAPTTLCTCIPRP